MTRRRQRRARLPLESFSATTTELAHDGRGIAHIEGKATFIHGALPGESVEFRYTGRRSQYDEGVVDRVLQPAPERVTPRCAHFDLCGGCSLQHLAAERQIEYKQQWLLSNLARIGRLEPEQVLAPLTGPFWGYRHKARLGVKYVTAKQRVLVGFRERNKPFVADLRRCEVLHPRVGTLLEELAALIGELSIYNQLPQVEVAVGDDHVALCLRILSPLSANDRALLSAFAQHHTVQIWLQPKGPDTVQPLWPEEAQLSYRLADEDLRLTFLPQQFVQINAALNPLMIRQALDLLDLSSQDRVLDLFCGLGNFSLPLARRARQVVGIEGSADLVAQAQRNAEDNAIHNVEFHAVDLTTDWSQQPWYAPVYNKVLLDPPRSGAAEAMPLIAALQPQRIVYVSCHPATLARDVGILVHEQGYRLRSVGVMDMFPHTAHVESIALLEMRK